MRYRAATRLVLQGGCRSGKFRGEDASVQPPERVDGRVVQPDFVMEMRPCGSSRRANPPNRIAGTDDVPCADQNRRQVRILRRNAVAVIELDQQAVIAIERYVCDRAAGRGQDGVVMTSVEVDPCVHAELTPEGVHPHAEGAVDLPAAGEWPTQGQCSDGGTIGSTCSPVLREAFARSRRRPIDRTARGRSRHTHKRGR